MLPDHSILLISSLMKILCNGIDFPIRTHILSFDPDREAVKSMIEYENKDVDASVTIDGRSFVVPPLSMANMKLVRTGLEYWLDML